MTENKEIKIKAAKGRPMLTWVGKRPINQVTAFPAQHIETFDPNRDLGKRKPDDVWSDWSGSYPKGGLLFHGDNKEVLIHLIANGFRGKINLIYIDPPFDSGADYIRKVQLRASSNKTKVDGLEHSLGEQIQYTDIWANDNYLQFMYERLLLLKELLSEDGSIYLHCDPTRSHHLRCLLDEIFGQEHFINEITWKRSNPHGNQETRYGSIHDNILFYSKGSEYYWEPQFTEHDQSYIDNFYKYIEEGTGRRYQLGPLNNFAGVKRPNLTYEWNGHYRTWRYTKERMQELERQGRLVYSSNRLARQKLYLDEMKGVPPQDLWLSIKLDKSEYPTQKPEALLEQIIKSSCPENGIVLDCFIGSGTTAAVAQKLGRRWIGCDINKGAIQTTSKRLQSIIQEQIKELSEPVQKPLINTDENNNVNVPPAQLSFTVWRVNDYDLAVQHNEAVNLACEHIGVERTRSDGFFDGTLGKRLVKIVPFGHPLTPLDLEEVKKELEARPDEDRNIVLVCLGKELAADSWLEDWNRLRKGNDAVNRIEVIELRTDPKYGKFIVHSPASAKVDIQKENGIIKVNIEDFISPTIIDRLEMDMQIFKAKITDWRSMVDCVMIDTAYDGNIFNVVLSDVPEKKDDLVNGTYELPAPEGETTVAVKIIDMLGEEVLVVKKL